MSSQTSENSTRTRLLHQSKLAKIQGKFQDVGSAAGPPPTFKGVVLPRGRSSNCLRLWTFGDGGEGSRGAVGGNSHCSVPFSAWPGSGGENSEIAGQEGAEKREDRCPKRDPESVCINRD